MKGIIRIFTAAVVCAWLASGAVAQQTGQPATDRITVPFSDPERPGTLKVNLLDGTVTIKVPIGATCYSSPTRRKRARPCAVAGKPNRRPECAD
jgi:hypothetical protein